MNDHDEWKIDEALSNPMPDPDLATPPARAQRNALSAAATMPLGGTREPDPAPLDVERLRSPRNSLGKLALPKGLMERAVEQAWDAPGVRTDIGDPSEGIVMTSLSELADAICNALARLAHSKDEP